MYFNGQLHNLQITVYTKLGPPNLNVARNQQAGDYNSLFTILTQDETTSKSDCMKYK